MVTIIEQPNELVLTRNPVVFKLQTDNYFLTAGVRSVAGFRSVSAPAAGNTLTLAFGADSITFTFAAALDNSGLKLRTNAGSLSEANYFQTILIPDLNSNNKLFNAFIIDYYVYLTNGYIRFTARETGEEYTLAITYTGITPTLLPNTAGVAPVVRENFKVFCELYTDSGQISAVFQKRIALEADPDASGYVIFDLSEHLNKYAASQRPDITDPSPVVQDLNCIKYYIRYGESYGSAPVDYYTTSTDPITAVLGGKDRLAYPVSSFYSAVVTADKSILTTQPLTRYTSLSCPAWIHFIRKPGVTTTTLRAIFYYSDNTSETKTLDFESDDYLITALPVSWNACVVREWVDPDDTRTLLKYDVCIVNESGSQISQTITFIVDYTNYKYERHFIYENSLGVYETLRCTGLMTNNVNYNFDEATKIRPYNYDIADPEDIILNASKKISKKISTGFHKRDYINSLEDFFLSGKKFFISESYGYIPIKATEKKQDFPSDDAMTYAADFTFDFAFTDKSYTPS